MRNFSPSSIPYCPEYIKRDNFVCVGHPGLVEVLGGIFAKPGLSHGDNVVIYKDRPNLILETDLLPDKVFPWPRQVIKHFRWRGFQRLFSPIKESKAMKSYRAACHLIEHGLATPMPLGAAEIRKFGFVINNAYVTEVVNEYTDLKNYRNSLPDGRNGMEIVLQQLAAYILKMHDSGLWHRDLNLSNFLITGKPGQQQLCLVDLNRARICRDLSMFKRAMDLARLDLNEWQATFFRYYCAERFRPGKMLAITNLVRARRRMWRKLITWTNPLRRKMGLK